MADLKTLLKRAILSQKDPSTYKELSNTEIATLIAQLVNTLGSHKSDLEKRITEGKTKSDEEVKVLLQEIKDHYRDVNLDELSELRGSVEKSLVEASQARAFIDQVARELREKADSLKDGKDGIVTDREIERAAEKAFGKIKLPNFKELVREEAQELRDALDRIEELIKRFNKMEKTVMKISAGSGSGSPLSWWRHEEFEMDGAATSVTLAGGSVGAAGTACIVRYQGQTLDLTSQYTVDGNKITLVGITPADGEYISVTYQAM
jgi:hypothetical protein